MPRVRQLPGSCRFGHRLENVLIHSSKYIPTIRCAGPLVQIQKGATCKCNMIAEESSGPTAPLGSRPHCSLQSDNFAGRRLHRARTLHAMLPVWRKLNLSCFAMGSARSSETAGSSTAQPRGAMSWCYTQSEAKGTDSFVAGLNDWLAARVKVGSEKKEGTLFRG